MDLDDTPLQTPPAPPVPRAISSLTISVLVSLEISLALLELRLKEEHLATVRKLRCDGCHQSDFYRYIQEETAAEFSVQT